ncbi:hypothetical protein EBN03_22035 [Nocardia stercoris]|uniref:Uncharacterized protein n=2 Tax=Nocardia stercoris TaxID=2483361 RepID=A0A3M2L0T1_9NOCA|nr:hypothetical protein EBN03_22035 [Nocardia stercoris]
MAPSSNGVWGAPVATLADPAPRAAWGEQSDPDGWPAHLPPPPPQRVDSTWNEPKAAPAAGADDLGAPPKAKPAVIAAMVVGLVAMMAAATGVVVAISHSHIRGNAAQSAAPTTTALVPATSTVAPVPTTTPAPPARFSFTEQAKDWDITKEDTTLHAEWVEGIDHPDCGEIDASGKLAALGCQYAAEMVYRGEGGDLMITEFVLGMGTPEAATEAAAPGQLADTDIVLRPESYISDYGNGGASRWKADAQGSFVVYTVVTADSYVSEDTVDKYERFRHTDTMSSLMVR